MNQISSVTVHATAAVKFIISAINRILSSLYHLLHTVAILGTLQILDLFIFILNISTPLIASNQTVSKPFSPDRPPQFSEHPFIWMTCCLARLLGPDLSPEWLKWWSVWDGVCEDGKWKEAKMDDATQVSRGPCPGLNALANHGIINYSGRDLSFHQIASAISRTYNVSPFFAVRATVGASPLFEGRKGINLSDLSAHGMIEHDASLLRPDIDSSSQKTFKDIQSHPSPELIERFFPSAKRPVTPSDCSKALTIRRAECAANNPTFYRTLKLDMIGSENCAILLAITGGDRHVVRNLTGIKGYECFDTEWRPAERSAFGLTMVNAQFLLAWIELGTGSTFRPKHRDV
ncbi:hypothetical protein CROQUDRAFT_36573 [Cronartium quercuum f. sp. fusiforme G11]|uniref:Heme haloperoxidase family profile domain-containing protein n=1 Tax=Cronartium quercuum f. sp. fusiforme G11 TaxID=708437 RepID=A0A9P6NWE2_9BASI|nr:hypothetical protein CROQUDRAFT_36573 [Cronartium quercuum f. sp. fusiforme G11]